jgi:hypothetical protein
LAIISGKGFRAAKVNHAIGIPPVLIIDFGVSPIYFNFSDLCVHSASNAK